MAGMHRLTEMETAYLAGLVDGEGCIHIARVMANQGVNPSYVLRLAISQCDQAYLEYWRLKLGVGRVYRHKYDNENFRDGFDLVISANDARMVLDLIKEHLMV